MSHPAAALIDLDGYLQQRVRVLNARGGRGHESGVRIFDCPVCGDARGRGWLHVLGFVAGCYNAGCAAEPRLAGGAIEWVRLAESLRSRGEAWALLHRDHPRLVALPDEPAPAPAEDFVIPPPGLVASWDGSGGLFELECATFARRQWGIEREDLLRWGLGRCRTGPYAYRVVVPVVLASRTVAFMARTVRHAEPKYLNSRSEPDGDRPAECGRPAAAWLFNLDAVRPGDRVVLVEGAGDAMAYARRAAGWVPVALCGQAMTPQKLAMLAAARPAAVAVALDPGPAEDRRAVDHCADLMAWGVAPTVTLGSWAGAKDAGAGAGLTMRPPGLTLADRVAARVRP